MSDHSPDFPNNQKQEIIDVYHRAAASYEQVGIRAASYFGGLFIEKLGLPAGVRILDVATGRGSLLFRAAEKVGPLGRVIGIDLAPGMVTATAAEIRARKLVNVEVCLMDGDYPSFQEESFDYLLCGFALHFLDYSNALVRFRKLLRPNGVMGILVPFIPMDHPADLERWQWLFQLTREVFPPDFVPPASWTAPNKFKTPELLAGALREAGFVQVSVYQEEKVLHFTDEEDWWAWEWSQASRFWLEGMSPEGLAKFKAVSFEKLRSMKELEGIPMRWGALMAMGRPN